MRRQMLGFVQRVALVVILALLQAVGAIATDHALVVGIDQYKNIPGANLNGCANDARDVARSLEMKGFKVTVITDGQASREDVLAALRQMRAINKANERFVFYFAGHGSGPKPAVILTHTSLQGANTHDIRAEELNAEIKAIPASSRTVLLDSCFSGAMSRGMKGRRLRSRYYPRTIGEKDLVLANNQDTNSQFTGVSPSGPAVSAAAVCYFTAARENEVAQEDEFDGRPHGVFTYYLLASLQPSQGTWGALQSTVSAKVVEHLQDQQHPTLTPKYTSSHVFGAVAGQPSVPPAQTGVAAQSSVWNLLNSDNVERTKVSLMMEPDAGVIPIGRNVSFSVSVGAAGYLLLLEHGTTGRVNLLFPDSGSVAQAHVTRGQVIRIPSDAGMAYAPDAEGTERLRAFLFTSESDARAIIDALRSSGAGTTGTTGAEFSELVRALKSRNAKDLRLQDVQASQGSARFYTSDIIFQVTP